MPDPTASDTASRLPEEQAIRERVKGVTSQVLQEGRLDPEAVRDIVRTVIGAPAPGAAAGTAQSRDLFAAVVTELDAALMTSSNAAHEALQRLASRGKDFSDNDLKQALVGLRKLEQDYAAAVNRITEALSVNLQREMMEIAAHAQNVGVEASARVAGMMRDFADGIAAAPGVATIRDAGVRMALLASGMLAGVADALRDQSVRKNGE
jgi:hypothetical protein